MSQENGDTRNTEQTLQTLFAAELFSKLSKPDQKTIIAQIEALLSRE